MKAAALLVILLSHQGYWFGGQEGTVEIRWAVSRGLPQADLTWELMFETVRVGSGKVAMKGGDEATVVKIRPPQVRVRTELRLICAAAARDGGKELARAEANLFVFPGDLLDGLAHRIGRRQVFVLASDEDLVKALEQAKVSVTRLKDPASLQVQRADIIFVGPNFLDRSPFAQGPLLEQAEAGASIFFFAQDLPQRLSGYAVVERALPPQLQWRAEHPLFYDLAQDDLASWLRARESARAIQLPAGEPALEIAYWPRESPGDEPTPIDALVASRATGKGRVAMWQIPLGAFDSDPRSQILLRNAMDYLLSRPEPTPPPSKRQPKKEAREKPAPGVIVPPGG